MFDLLVFGEQPRELIIDPVKIFGNGMIGFEGCAFYTRVKPEMIKFIGNRFYTDWFDVEEALIDGTMQCRNKSSNESIPITKDKLIGFTEKLEQAISFRFEVGFEENGQPVIKVRAVNLAYNNMSAEWKRGNVPSIQVTSLEVKTLEMNPAIAQLGFDLPFYPVLFSPLELTMQVYEKYVVKVMPSILSQVVKHTDFSPESWKSVMTAKKLFKNTSRYNIWDRSCIK